MDKATFETELFMLSYAINVACDNYRWAKEFKALGNGEAEAQYLDECAYWSKRACNVVRGLGLKPMDVCPKQEAWSRMAPLQPVAAA